MHVLTIAAGCSAVAEPLPKLSIDPRGISISGLSSGADFAAQFGVAFSSVLVGHGVFAGQPWGCSTIRFPGEPQMPQCSQRGIAGTDQCEGNFPAPSVPICHGCDEGQTLHYDHCKNQVQVIDTNVLAGYARNASASGLIDDVAHLQTARVYLYRGTKDACYHAGSVSNVGKLLQALGTPAANILMNSTTPSAHSWPTDNWGTSCGSGVIENCHYDGPGACLSHIYKESEGAPLTPPDSATAFSNASLLQFDQVPFFSADNNGTATYNATTPRATGLAPRGWIYVPKACRVPQAGCKLHLSLHGCGVNGYYDNAVKHLGFEAWGEANGIVILFPRLQPHGYTKQTSDGCVCCVRAHHARCALCCTCAMCAPLLFRSHCACWIACAARRALYRYVSLYPSCLHVALPPCRLGLLRAERRRLCLQDGGADGSGAGHDHGSVWHLTRMIFRGDELCNSIGHGGI